MKRVLSPKEVVRLLRAEVRKAESITAWARKASIPRSNVSLFLHGKRAASKTMIRALRLRKALSLIGDPRALESEDIGHLLRAEADKAGSQSAWARETGIHRSEINKVLQGKQPPNKRMIAALGLRVVFVRTRHAS